MQIQPHYQVLEREALKVTFLPQYQPNHRLKVAYVELQPVVDPLYEVYWLNVSFRFVDGISEYRYACWTVRAETDKTQVTFGEDGLQVQPKELKGNRLGTYLLSRLIQWAQSRPEYTTRKAKVRPDPHKGEPLKRWYRRHGFVLEGELGTVSQLRPIFPQNIEPFPIETLDGWWAEAERRRLQA